MKVREAKTRELRYSLKLLKENYEEKEPFDEEVVKKLLLHLNKARDGIILVALSEDEKVVGTFGGVIHPSLMSEESIASKVFLAVEEESAAVKLLKSADKWAILKGADQFEVSAEFWTSPEEIKKLYEKEGFELTKIHFSKRW